MTSTQARSHNGKDMKTQAAQRSEVWQPRPVSVARSVAQYSRFVAAMKIALPVTAAFLLLLIVVVPLLRQDDERFEIGTAMLPDDTADTLSMVNARYFGTDSKGQPFSVTAERVREREGADQTIELAAAEADISLDSGSWLAVSAKSGLYDRGREVLDLAGEVNLYQDQGYEIHTATARVYLKDGSAMGSDPVNGQGPFGRLEAEGFELYEKGDVIVFTGPSHVILQPRLSFGAPRTEPQGGSAEETQ